ncbi:ISNCY family transposase [Pricia sp.]|uniref:ISNCY family transposase n=1 Tax=Pricia sp. TaxID=2268138 RepID=UPI003592FF18
MKMKLFETLKLKFEQPDWANNPEFGLIDSILEEHSELIALLEEDITSGEKRNTFGRKDTPSVEQIVRAAIYKELKRLTYRELAYHQGDSRICSHFLKIDELKPYSFQVLQKYISKVGAGNLDRFLVELNRIAIGEGLEDLRQVRQDSTVVGTDIHYPTNNALVWDCIRESHRLLKHLEKEITDLGVRDYTKGAKKTFYKINNTKSKDKRADLFKKQLATFTKSINQVSNAVKKKQRCSVKAAILQLELEGVLPVMRQVYAFTEKREIKGLEVPNDEKLFSIYERHTDIIVKGGRKVQFGHKVDISTGRSNLVLACDIPRGNPRDTDLYGPAMDKLVEDYRAVPRDYATDGGYASAANARHAKEKGIVNVVFNKVVGSMCNQVSSLNMETRLKKWRSGIEANISNLKRGFSLNRCNWKGWAHFKAKVLWGIIGYNIRVMTNALVEMMVPKRKARAA